jgi:hypothetical protein
MIVFIASIIELSQNFFNSDPLKFNKYFAITPDYQKYCLNANLATCFTITLAKEVMLIHDIAIHLLIGGIKLTTGAVKGICAIASGILGIETDHQTPSKQAAVHIGFACVYAADILASITNVNKTYLQNLIDKIEIFFADFLKKSNKNIIFSDIEIEQELKITLEELEKRNADFNQLEEEIEKTAQNLNEPFECEKIINEILNPNTRAILARIKSNIENNQEEQRETLYREKQGVTNWFESDDNTEDFWFEDEFRKNKTSAEKDVEESLSFSRSSTRQDLNEFSTIPNLDLLLTASDQLEDSKIKVKSASQISKSFRKTLSNIPCQTSARARALKYDNERKNRSKNLSLANS